MAEGCQSFAYLHLLERFKLGKRVYAIERCESEFEIELGTNSCTYNSCKEIESCFFVAFVFSVFLLLFFHVLKPLDFSLSLFLNFILVHIPFLKKKSNKIIYVMGIRI